MHIPPNNRLWISSPDIRVLIVIFAVSLFLQPRAHAQSQSINVFDCGVALRFISTSIGELAHASAALVKHPVNGEERYLLVTAYHNLTTAIACNLVPHDARRTGEIRFIGPEVIDGFGTNIYCSLPSDLAIIEINAKSTLADKLDIKSTALRLADL